MLPAQLPPASAQSLLAQLARRFDCPVHGARAIRLPGGRFQLDLTEEIALPRDAEGQSGAYEAALQDNHTMAVEDQPLEILRTIHSFDPCLACAVHVMDPEGGERLRVQVC